MGQPFTASSRRNLLDQYFAARQQLYDLTVAIEETEGEEERRLGLELDAVQMVVSDLWDQYRDGVPVVSLSRCPFTGQEVRHSIDLFGLDGLWWNYDAPVRSPEQLPPTFLALAGAVKLGEPLEIAPFLCRPGPEVPYVVPRLLQMPGVKAVVSSVQVGPHVAYPIFYYADPIPQAVTRINTWGTADYWFHSPEGDYVWDRVLDDAADFDFDLARWIRAGKLLWIVPGDPELLLHGDLLRCPYLDLEGRKEPMAISQGVVWSAMGMGTQPGFAVPQMEFEQSQEVMVDDR